MRLSCTALVVINVIRYLQHEPLDFAVFWSACMIGLGGEVVKKKITGSSSESVR